MWARSGINISSLSEVRLKVITSCHVVLKAKICCNVALETNHLPTLSGRIGERGHLALPALL